jgi:mediator of RNA polymerase II transcription subunit 14
LWKCKLTYASSLVTILLTNLHSVPNPTGGPRISTMTELKLTLSMTDFTERFFTSLNVFSAGIVSRMVDLKILHRKRIKHHSLRKPGAVSSLPPGLSVPPLALRLTDLLGSHRGGAGSRISAWAVDCVLLSFRGVRAVPASGAESQPAVKDRFMTTVDARLKVLDRAKFSLLTGNMERDVAFNPRLGVFALRLEGEMGTSVLEKLTHRIQAIGRLVDCVDAIRRSSSDVKCESITLARIVFSYSDAMGQSHGSTASASVHRWKASLDLRNDEIKMSLEKGNPHLRTLDIFNDLLNSQLGFAKVPQYLAFTLSLLKAFDTIEDSWKELDMDTQGRAQVFARHIDWYTIRYTLSNSRRANIEIRLRERQGELSWHVGRHEPGHVALPADDIKPVLKEVWEASDRKWTSFGDSVACGADDRIATLLQTVNKAMLDHAKKPFSPPKPAATSRPAPKQKKPPATQARAPQQSNVVILDD